MKGMHLGNIKQSHNLISGRCKPCIGMIFASLVVTVSSGLSAQNSTLPLPDEVPVFGSENRSATLHYFSSNLLKHMQNSANQEAFNGLEQITPAVSLVAISELVIEDERPNDIHQKYHGLCNIITTPDDALSKVVAEGDAGYPTCAIERSIIITSGSLLA
jgi:hypothetical protein